MISFPADDYLHNKSFFCLVNMKEECMKVKMIERYQRIPRVPADVQRQWRRHGKDLNKLLQAKNA